MNFLSASLILVLLTACSSSNSTSEYGADNQTVGYSKKDGEYDALDKTSNAYDPAKLLFGNEKRVKITEESKRTRSGNSKQADDEGL